MPDTDRISYDKLNFSSSTYDLGALLSLVSSYFIKDVPTLSVSSSDIEKLHAIFPLFNLNKLIS